MTSLETPFPGTHLLQPKVFSDARGDFVKTYHAEVFAELGCSFVPAEEFYSTSRAGVLRGMHFQLPPHDHAKLVYCLAGSVHDVLLDLRRSSPTYGQSFGTELSGTNRRLLFVPSGVAHGFLAREEGSLLIYKTSTVHAPSHDAGVRWDSFGYRWPVAPDLVSPRDAAFLAWAEFSSPF
jgi:dTDP-4-dehydrorhamnose 3,5-epimerase